MKIIENKYEGHVFPKQVKCEHCGSILELEREHCGSILELEREHCGSILELEREDCVREWNRCTHWYDYRYICPCCKQETKFEELL